MVPEVQGAAVRRVGDAGGRGNPPPPSAVPAWNGHVHDAEQQRSNVSLSSLRLLLLLVPGLQSDSASNQITINKSGPGRAPLHVSLRPAAQS